MRPVTSIPWPEFKCIRRMVRSAIFAVVLAQLARSPARAEIPGFAPVRNLAEALAMADAARGLDVPHPWVPSHPEWETLYYFSISLGLESVAHGTKWNGFAPRYIDEAYDNSVYQWDTIFISQWARYLSGVLPAMSGLDNFYGKQHRSESSDDYGAICRQLWESDGSDVFDVRSPEFTNPPIFAWAEWDYYLTTGDASRLAAVVPVLDAYYRWMARARIRPTGHYYSGNQGTGMDDTPKPDDVWGRIDTTAQQALAALAMSRILSELYQLTPSDDMVRLYAFYRDEYSRLKDMINRTMWDSAKGFYYDIHRDGSKLYVESIASFWPMLAEVCSPEQSELLALALVDPKRFGTTTPFPSLSISDPAYKRTGAYWRGGVWAPTNYMVVRGLANYGHDTVAHRMTTAYLNSMWKVFVGDRIHTLWEYYQPERAAKGLRAQPDFVGWSALGPVAMLIENTIGVRLDVPHASVTWVLLEEQAGLRNVRLGASRVDLVAQRDPLDHVWRIWIDTGESFSLQLIDPWTQARVTVGIGVGSWEVVWQTATDTVSVEEV